MEASPGPTPSSPILADIVARAEARAACKAADFGWDPVRGRAGPPPSLRPVAHGPLVVLAGNGGRSVFSDMRDGRLRLLAPGETDAAASDLVVLTRAHHLPENPRELDLPDEVWRRLASGQTKLVLDISGEGMVHTPERSGGFHRFLDAAGIDPANCVYVTQERGFEADYLAHRSQQGHAGAPFQVLVYDRFIRTLMAGVEQDGGAIFQRRLQAYASAPRHRGRRFLSLNNTFRPHRALFLLRLLRDGLWDRGHISVGSFVISRGTISKRMRAAAELRTLVDELYPLLDELEARSPSYIGLGGALPYGGSDDVMIMPEMYPEFSDSWFSVVIETDDTSRLHRITEKPFKPLLCFHPFIVLGPVHALKLIREYGFETFPGFFDESYDEQTGLRARFDDVYGQVAGLCAMDEAEVARHSAAAAEQVVFNAWWGLTQLPRLFRERIDAPMVDWLIDFVHRRR